MLCEQLLDVLGKGAKLRAVVSETLFLEIPHEGVEEIRRLKSYPHHFQRRKRERWVFEESQMRGNVEKEIDTIIKAVSKYLK